MLEIKDCGDYEEAKKLIREYSEIKGAEAAGVITANGDENKSEAKMNEIREFVKTL